MVRKIAEKTFVPKGYAAICYEKEGNTKFRDRVLLFYDGKLLFERFCWGEAAGLVFAAWADGVSAEGEIAWRKPFDGAVKEEALPKVIDEATEEFLRFDGAAVHWKLEDSKKADPAHGYSAVKVLLGRVFGR